MRADGIHGENILDPILAVHPECNVLLVEVLEARNKVTRIQEGQRGVLAHFRPVRFSCPAAPLAVLGNELQSLTESAHGPVHQKQALCRPTGAAVIGEKLPVHITRLGVSLGTLRRDLRLATRIVEHGEGAALIKIKLPTVQSVDVGIAVDGGRRQASFDVHEATRASQFDDHLLDTTLFDFQRNAFSIFCYRDLKLLVIVWSRDHKLDLRGRLVLVPQLDIHDVGRLGECESELWAWSVRTVIHYIRIAISGPNQQLLIGGCQIWVLVGLRRIKDHGRAAFAGLFSAGCLKLDALTQRVFLEHLAVLEAAEVDASTQKAFLAKPLGVPVLCLVNELS
mmetsp:Transcript_37096/g.85751  ORF Transcript_37096/g.85751 Transcript_37096/m.85751 type:complete len:338 (+) Transcript_37096:561-1574(+)